MTVSSNTEIIVGLHAVRKALESGDRACEKLVVASGGPGNRLRPILDLARKKGIQVDTLSPAVFQKRYKDKNSQNLVGYFSIRRSQNLEELLALTSAHPNPIVVILDEIQDPQNLGALIRSAWVLGLQGLVLPKHRSAPLNETVAKCSAGAIESLPIASVSNLKQAAETLKEKGFWIVGIDMEGDRACYEFDFNTPVALVIGGEEKGVRPILKKACDFTVSIPMAGKLDSLNLSTAAAIVFYEIHKQRIAADSNPKP